MNLIEVSPREGYGLFVRYDDGASGVVDLSAFVGKGVFSEWLKPGVFEQVQLAEAGHPEWPGEIDLCPDALYLQLTGKKPEEIFPALNRPSAHA
ncbi:MAG: DUF2442 domain-containing protein [Verrucomicrobia subdivision 3 bacterium]|nr:DUF2442 domain-containing protein [Limisphaerales bacterium]